MTDLNAARDNGAKNYSLTPAQALDLSSTPAQKGYVAGFNAAVPLVQGNDAETQTAAVAAAKAAQLSADNDAIAAAYAARDQAQLNNANQVNTIATLNAKVTTLTNNLATMSGQLKTMQDNLNSSQMVVAPAIGDNVSAQRVGFQRCQDLFKQFLKSQNPDNAMKFARFNDTVEAQKALIYGASL